MLERLTVSAGASFLAAIFTVDVTGALVVAPARSEFASVATQVIVRVRRVLPSVGSSLVLRYVTLRNAAWYCASVAVPLNVRTPVLEA